MPLVCRNLFIENTKSNFKNRKKINYSEGPLAKNFNYRKVTSHAFFRVKSHVSRSVGFKLETPPLRVASTTTPPITQLCLY